MQFGMPRMLDLEPIKFRRIPQQTPSAPLRVAVMTVVSPCDRVSLARRKTVSAPPQGYPDETVRTRLAFRFPKSALNGYEVKTKMPLYACPGAREYSIIDAVTRMAWVHRQRARSADRSPD
jgi:hypothetical protein